MAVTLACGGIVSALTVAVLGRVPFLALDEQVLCYIAILRRLAHDLPRR